jgi:cysteinyl-tRNA synthetase
MEKIESVCKVGVLDWLYHGVMKKKNEKNSKNSKKNIITVHFSSSELRTEVKVRCCLISFY